VCVCVCVSVRQREKERERKRERQREGMCEHVGNYVIMLSFPLPGHIWF
jgi:hypothetical protein